MTPRCIEGCELARCGCVAGTLRLGTARHANFPHQRSTACDYHCESRSAISTFCSTPIDRRSELLCKRLGSSIFGTTARIRSTAKTVRQTDNERHHKLFNDEPVSSIKSPASCWMVNSTGLPKLIGPMTPSHVSISQKSPSRPRSYRPRPA